MNSNLLLYGSYARGDEQKDSDVDLLTITEGFSHKAVFNKVNISYYNRLKITEMALSGALFVLHLNKEARVLIDEDDILTHIIYDKFKLKANYDEDIQFSKILLIDIYNNYDNVINFAYANSKVSWCLRTLYSAIGANHNLVLFSREKIAKHFGKEAIGYLNIKNSNSYQIKLISKIIKYTDRFLERPLLRDQLFRPDLQAYRNEVINSLTLHNVADYDGY
jgi:predicted nucleotidyltransferase